MHTWFKGILLGLLKRSNVTVNDLMEANITFQYPDLVNRIVAVEQRTYFSEVCTEYLTDVMHQADTLHLSLGHLLQKYLNPRGLYFLNDVFNVEHKLMNDVKSLHKTDIRNKVMRDSEFRKVVKFYIPEIESNDCSYAIALLQQIAALGEDDVK